MTTVVELIAYIDEYVRNSAIDSFQNLRMNTILKQLVFTGYTDTSYANLNELKTAWRADKAAGINMYRRAKVQDTGYIYEYDPKDGYINWTASYRSEKL